MGVSGLTLSAVLLALLLIIGRNPKPAPWRSDALVTNVYAPPILALGIVGVVFIVYWAVTLGTSGMSWLEIGLAAAVAVAGAVVLKVLKPNRRIEQFKQEEAGRGAVVIPIRPPDGKPEPPVVDRRAA